MGPRRLNDKRWWRGYAGFEQSCSQVLVGEGGPPSSHSLSFFLISLLLLLLLLLFIILACCAPLEHHPLSSAQPADSPYLLQMGSAFLALCLRLSLPHLLLYSKAPLLARESPFLFILIPCNLVQYSLTKLVLNPAWETQRSEGSWVLRSLVAGMVQAS